MKWFSLLISFLVGKFNSYRPPSLKESAMAVLEELAYKSRKPAALIFAGVFCLLLLCGGFFMTVIDLTNQFDREGFVRFTAGLGAGLFLVVLNLGILTWVFTSAWPGAKEHSEARHNPPRVAPSSLEQALAALVMDFVKEREFKREQAHSTMVPREPYEKESPPIYQ